MNRTNGILSREMEGAPAGRRHLPRGWLNLALVLASWIVMIGAAAALWALFA